MSLGWFGEQKLSEGRSAEVNETSRKEIGWSSDLVSRVVIRVFFPVEGEKAGWRWLHRPRQSETCRNSNIPEVKPHGGGLGCSRLTSEWALNTTHDLVSPPPSFQ